MKKYTKQSGFMHLQFIIAIAAVIIGAGLVGSYVVSRSNAAAGGTYNYTNCTLNVGFKMYGSTAEVIQHSRGSAVWSTTVEIKDYPKAKRTYPHDINGYELDGFYYRYTLDAVKKNKTRTATISAYCPNAKPEWRTYTKTSVQIP